MEGKRTGIVFAAVFSICTAASAETNCATKSGYDALKTGVTYDQAVAILGCQGVNAAENNIGGVKNVVYMWWGKDRISNMSATFQNGKLIQKAQFLLKD